MSEQRLRVLLEHGAAQTRPRNEYVEAFHREVERSPLHYRDDVSDRMPAAFEPSPRDKVVEDGGELAARRVQEYLDETFRIHEGRVLRRFRLLVMVQEIHRSAPLLQTLDYPRVGRLARNGGDQLGLRHDRVDDLTRLIKGAGRRGRVAENRSHQWRELLGVPPELLDDHDIEHAANFLPARIAPLVAQWSVAGPDPSERRQRITQAARPLQRLVEDSWSHATTGARVEPALVFLGGVLSDICAEQELFDRKYPPSSPRPSHVTAALLRDMVTQVHIPRWTGGRELDPEDAAAISRLGL